MNYADITLGMLRILLTVDITRGDSMALCHADEEWVPDIEKDGARTTLLWGLDGTGREAEDREGRRSAPSFHWIARIRNHFTRDCSTEITM